MDVPLLGSGSLRQGATPRRRPQMAWWTPPLHAVVLTPTDDGHAAHHYTRDQRRPDRTWIRHSALANDATGPAALAYTGQDLHALVPTRRGIVHLTLTDAQWRPLDVVAPGRRVALAASASGLTALIWDGTRLDRFEFARGWRHDTTLPADGPGLLAEPARGQDVFTVVPRNGWLVEVDPSGTTTSVARVGAHPAALATVAGGHVLGVPRRGYVELWRCTSQGWRSEPETLQATDPRAVALAHTQLGGWVQALTQERESVFHSHRQETPAATRWMRSACLRLRDTEPFVTDARPSTKVAQVSGELDAQPGRGPTLSSSLSTAGIRGTDLGVRVEHEGRGYLLFGDTHWTRRRWITLDSLARIEGPSPVADAPRIAFHDAPLLPRGLGVTRREYDVPLDAFSYDGWFVFVSSNHFRRHQVMGRSVLTKALDDPATVARGQPIRLRPLGTFSEWRFINVSVQVIDHTLWVWGSGGYRADDLRLARLVLDAATRRALGAGVAPRELPWEFWAGGSWSPVEADAVGVVAPAAFGEVSVRWVPEIERFVLLAMSGPEDPIGPAVVWRTAEHPQGPWSLRRRLLDWVAGGMSPTDVSRRFIRAHLDDEVGDRLFKAQAGVTGGAYAPYFFDSRVSGGQFVFRYTLSTWNPYQVVLMEHRIPLSEIE